MTDEPELPPSDANEEPDIEALADEAAAEEAQAAEGAAVGEATTEEGAPAPAPAAERAPSKLALVAVALVALLAGAGTAYAVGHRGGGCPPKGDALKVEGDKIPNAEFQRRVELLRALYDVRPPTDPAKLTAFRGDAAKGMAVATLVAHD